MNQQLDTLHGDAPLTVEQRLSALEVWVARVSMRAHNDEWQRQGHPKDRVGALLAAPDEKTVHPEVAAASDELRLLERELAYDAARMLIESECVLVSDHDVRPCRYDVGHYYTGIGGVHDGDDDLHAAIDRAVRFLELIGCLQRDSDLLNIVSIKVRP